MKTAALFLAGGLFWGSVALSPCRAPLAPGPASRPPRAAMEQVRASGLAGQVEGMRAWAPGASLIYVWKGPPRTP